MSCSLRAEQRHPLLTPGVILVQFLIAIDLALTLTGITNGAGTEANPFFAPFTEMGTLAMLSGVALYYSVIWIWFSFSSDWLRAATVGVLTAIHIYGLSSWVRLLFIEQFNIMFSNLFFLILGPALIAAFMTIYTYVDLTSCHPFDAPPPDTATTSPSRIDWK